MALVERLMRLNDDGTPMAHSQLIRHIAVHAFFAACNEIVAGRLTVAQVKTYLEMDTEDAAEFDALVALMPQASQAAARALYIHSVHSVFILAEIRAPGYDTPVGVRSKLGI